MSSTARTGSRRKGREAALQMLYQMEASGVRAEQAIHLFWANLGSSREGEDFANRIVRGCETEGDKIDEIIRKVSQHWRLERMTRVDRNILRLATYELIAMEDIPRRVTLNEAVELAKRYGSDGSAGFVNGVLDRIASDLGKD
ncbi:transcription antitermination factor NusB [Sandaracinus amylolyticus]|uniref:Transcription antitermination protein NusB n=1 Tax=Sandaracinus amylolyticus TaxID=927083 RepID=A0A0F6W408_9BACT|nr:transcription antitermination factor NusB [Sandaracinus amylolyticus]AKF06931.1 Transcription termination protein NusB [Sandaracinus amylolyticus]